MKKAKGGMKGGTSGNKAVTSPYSHSDILGRKRKSMIGGSGKSATHSMGNKAKKKMMT